ncbi:MAG: ABC transporter permease subunit [Nitriliruptorales bacterium]|nr:ABC transporter permease subunit [Nitriliruptorales bacterium]
MVNRPSQQPSKHDAGVQSDALAAAAKSGDLLLTDSGSALRHLLGQIVRAGRPLLAVLILWELAARILGWSPILVPPLAAIFEAMWVGIISGTLPRHVAWTLFRLFSGFLLGAAFGIVAGMISARVKWVADWTVPLVSLFLPIPALAFVPLFILWFGLGNVPVILLVAMASSMPVFMNAYTGTLTVDPLQINAAESMGARGRALFRRVILPGSLPYVLSGVRVGFARGWRAVIAGETVSATGFGLGWMIFTARSFLQTANVLVGIIFIGVVGLLCEKLLWETLEQKTVVKWGMVQEAR